MDGDPVPDDVDAARDPYPLMPGSAIEKPFERRGAAGSSGKAAMQAHRHHAWAALALAVEHVETVLQIGEELITGIEPLRRGKAHIV